ncbi:MAG: DUF2130 domain-containing protein [Salibacteraceae bacterium]
MSESKITCPNCGQPIDVDEVFAHQAEERLKKEYQAKAHEQAAQMAKQREALEKELVKLNELKASESERLKKKLEQEREVLDKEMANKLALEKKKESDKLREEYQLEMKSLAEENEKRKLENRELKSKEIELLQMRKKIEEQKEQMELDLQKKLLEKEAQIGDEIRKKEAEKNELKYKEYEKQINDQKKLVEEMRRKAEQGSMQLQGEVQELAIEEYLMSNFPLDTIEEIKKGARGADCAQIVNTRSRANCGKIYYESKRTKDFQPSWIEKFKADMREKNADIGVLVTEALPKGIDRMTNMEGVWVCTFEEFKSLANVLRESIVRISAALATQENKGDKMGMLYDFLTSNEFRLQIEGIVEGFTTMKTDLDSEKRAMARIWKSREKQLEKVLLNTTNMFGSIKGIAGNAIGTINALELPGFDEDENQNE